MDDDKDNGDVIVFNEPYRSLYDHLEDGESLFEKYFKYENMTADKRNYCYMLLNNIREVTNSKYVAKNQSNEFELGSMAFRRSERFKYSFYGVLSNGEERKTVDGVITISDNNIEIETNYYRFYEFLEDDERFYSTTDMFYQEDGRNVRLTIYSDGTKYVEPVDLLNDDEVSEYAYQKSTMLVRKKDNKMSN